MSAPGCIAILRHDPRVLPLIERHDGESVREGHALVLQEHYPYVGALGTPTREADLRAGWERTAARLREGAAPPNLGVYVHIPFCTARAANSASAR